WIPLGLALIAASALVPGLPKLVALHALAIGAVGGMIVGMITRTALGHTGRPLAAGLAETSAYVLVQLAALVRVFGGLLLPALYRETLLVSAALWAAAFAVYLVAYTPILTFARVDGKPG
ncbi:MAG: NnrS family protein, partial [Burkholderiales bacterium]